MEEGPRGENIIYVLKWKYLCDNREPVGPVIGRLIKQVVLVLLLSAMTMVFTRLSWQRLGFYTRLFFTCFYIGRSFVMTLNFVFYL